MQTGRDWHIEIFSPEMSNSNPFPSRNAVDSTSETSVYAFSRMSVHSATKEETQSVELFRNPLIHLHVL